MAMVNLQNCGAEDLRPGFSTMGIVFDKGEIFPGDNIIASYQIGHVLSQIDVKTTYDDGSVRMAVLTLERPDIAAGHSFDITLSSNLVTALGAPSISTQVSDGASTGLDFRAGLAQHDFTVDLTGASGQTTHIDVLAALEAALALGDASFWQMGELAVQARVEIPLPGSQRMIFDVTLFKGGGLNIDAQFNNDGAMEATGGRVHYTITCTLDGRQLVQETVDQGLYQNWHSQFSSDASNGGQGLGDPSAGWLNIRQDIAHLASIGAVARYDLTLGVDEALLDAWGDAALAPGWTDPLAVNGIAQYMPGTGGRADIGFTTAANTAWLMTQDARAASYAMGQAEAASGVPWNLWDAANDTWLGTDAYPSLWTDPRGGSGAPGDAQSGGLTQHTDGDTGWSLDSAHQPDLSYVPYLLTGQRWILDNLQAQASWNIMSQWPAIRGGANDLLVQDNQVRGAAWSLRQIDEAAWASPDGSVEKAAFTEASAANWRWLVAQIPLWTEQQGEAHGWLPGAYGIPGAMPPWQQDYFASTVIAAASRGNADALTFLEWQSNFLVGRFTHAAQGFAAHDGAAYLIAIADPTTGEPYTAWAEIGARTTANGWSNGLGWEHSQGDYAQLALATLAGIASLGGHWAAAAADAYHALLADQPPFTSAAAFRNDPAFALAAPASTGLHPVDNPPPLMALVLGDDGENVIILGAASQVEAKAGDDVIYGSHGADRLEGGRGNDTYVIHNAQAVLVEQQGEGYDTAWFAVSGGNMGANVEKGALIGDATSLYGAETGEALVANPTIRSIVHGNGGEDTLWGGTAADTLFGGAGDDLLRDGGGADQLIGGAGDDAYVISDVAVRTIENVGEGSDTAWVAVNAWTVGTHVEIARLAAPGAWHLLGGEGADTLVANQGEASLLDGGGGHDTLWGSRFADTLMGGVGNDIFRGQGGADSMVGGIGDDQFVVFSPDAMVIEAPGEGYDIVYYCGPGTFSIGAHVEEARLSETGTGLIGNTSDNLLVGNNAGLGCWLDGGAGDDVIFGTPAADTIMGGTGNDLMYSYGGADRFVVTIRDGGFDRIVGFEHGEAKLDFTGSGLQVADLFMVQDGPDTLIASGSSLIILYGTTGMTASDFLF